MSDRWIMTVEFVDPPDYFPDDIGSDASVDAGNITGTIVGVTSDAEATTIRAENEGLRFHLRQVLLGGAHEGPCTNDNDPWDSCDAHVKMAEYRTAEARRYMDDLDSTDRERP